MTLSSRLMLQDVLTQQVLMQHDWAILALRLMSRTSGGSTTGTSSAALHAAGPDVLAHGLHRAARHAAVLDAHRAAPLDVPHVDAFDVQGILLLRRSWTCRASLLGLDSLSRHARSGR